MFHSRNPLRADHLIVGIGFVHSALAQGLQFPEAVRIGFLTSFVTLSFLMTTPEAWVAPLGHPEHGFPYLSGAGRLVLKDVMLWAGDFLLMVESAKALRVKYLHTSTFLADRRRDPTKPVFSGEFVNVD